MLTLKKLVVMLCLLATAVSACRPTPAQQPEIVIGVLATLSGDEAIVERSGRMTVNAAELAIRQINDAGGLEINGQKYQLVLAVQDDTGEPEGAVAAAQTLINQKRAVVLVGPQFSKNAIPVADVAERSGVPMISPMSTIHAPQRASSLCFASDLSILFRAM
ncbi:MAG: hypothetical protein OHK0052_04860 [Anaerolineales bacterium]